MWTLNCRVPIGCRSPYEDQQGGPFCTPKLTKDQVGIKPRLFGVGLLVLEGLFNRTDPTIENGGHFRCAVRKAAVQ